MERAHRKGSVAGLLLNLTHLQVVLNTSLLYVQARLLDIQYKPDCVNDYIQLKTTDSIESL